MKRTITVILIGFMSIGALFAADRLDMQMSNQILFLLEEEKMARDLYEALGDQWNLRVFENIARAEETHRGRVEDLAETYAIEFRTLPAGQFESDEIQNLYNELLEKGELSAKDALEVGRLVEITDIDDINEMLDSDPPEDVRIVLERLKAGSENHLAAFERQLSR